MARSRVSTAQSTSEAAGLGPVAEAFLKDEPAAVKDLLATVAMDAGMRRDAQSRATRVVSAIRSRGGPEGLLAPLLREFDLASEEGLVLMCLAEALLRIPDPETVDDLIREKLTGPEWEKHLGAGSSLQINASVLGLMLADWVVAGGMEQARDFTDIFRRLLARSGEPLVRRAVQHGMQLIGRQFILGETIGEALDRAAEMEREGIRFSYDMLGEAAVTAGDAERYFARYLDAIRDVGAYAARGALTDPHSRPGVSVKLSALHPRYATPQRRRVLDELVPRLRALAREAAARGISLCVDAEEADLLELSLEVIEAVATDPGIRDWQGLGLAVQAYQKRAPHVIAWLAETAQRLRRRWMLRLVKGAYWDTEIKRAQERGLGEFPVFTRKAHTDVSYLACARQLLSAPERFYPQFATHNALTAATIAEMLPPGSAYEFQRLHGMGEHLYETLQEEFPAARYRVYAPVGSHRELLPYLVRRLLENGANNSFVNGLADPAVPVETLVADPLEKAGASGGARSTRIALPRGLFLPERVNSQGFDLSDRLALAELARAMSELDGRHWDAAPLVPGRTPDTAPKPVYCPARRSRVIGEVRPASAADAEAAMKTAMGAFPSWSFRRVDERAKPLEQAADALEQRRAEFIHLLVHEGGKTIPDALAEVREAADYCRYYAAQARRQFGAPVALPGPTGEQNQLSLHGRGVFACISPWNFPLAIFLGQIAAALAAGNTVIAKPAEQTPLIAAAAIRLLHEAGIPEDVLCLLPGPGAEIGARLAADPRLAGVAFTGSTDTAWRINAALAQRHAPIVPFIAETGGQNAMIVDSSALLEQAAVDIVTSAFDSAGQRCSALRVLFMQDEVAPRLIEMLRGAMAELAVGDPARLDTDVGPVIDEEALGALENHVAAMAHAGCSVFRLPLPATCAGGTFCAPTSIEISATALPDHEVFGPILHVARYQRDRLEQVLEAVRGTGYGLTLGIHTRLAGRAADIARSLPVGNVYVNRNMIGAVVGAQPFGGQGLSGTGPKAGGPHYLPRFAVEKTTTINTMAAGGNAALLAGDEF
ncbi:MAG: bifunctional proline dehydrogenase/L-glutamate gamma-semialdehyde dehydrogenase PutA [Betaproteobacteria bacterium]|nr:bifunctional proline dehydrogenase/L-glutamate gamma-semialdehyde dehydrogenase PutA [Betaproteobacteria bacterium]